MQQLRLITPTVVTLCGSTRFREQFHMANAQLTMAGYVVLSVGFFMHREGQHNEDCPMHERAEYCPLPRCNCGRTAITDAQKADLDVLHFAKIQMSHGIYVVNVAGYVGSSTMREVAFAIATHKTITFLEEDAGRTWMERDDVSHALGKQVAQFVEGVLPDLVVL